MTNRVEALFFLPSISLDEVKYQREEARGSSHSPPNTTANCRLLHSLALLCRWHHCDIGITGGRGARSRASPRAPKKVHMWSAVALRRAHGVSA